MLPREEVVEVSIFEGRQKFGRIQCHIGIDSFGDCDQADVIEKVAFGQLPSVTLKHASFGVRCNVCLGKQMWPIIAHTDNELLNVTPAVVLVIAITEPGIQSEYLLALR